MSSCIASSCCYRRLIDHELNHMIGDEVTYLRILMFQQLACTNVSFDCTGVRQRHDLWTENRWQNRVYSHVAASDLAMGVQCNA